MGEENFKGRLCSFGTLKADGGLFWSNGIYDGETPSHFLFLINGKLTAVLRASVIKIEFQNQSTSTGAAAKGGV